jgi:hypothetical protein
MKNENEFLAEVQTYDETLTDLDDAIAFAIANSEPIGEMKWLGQFRGGTFYADEKGSQWFADMTPYEVKLALSEQLLEDLEG